MKIDDYLQKYDKKKAVGECKLCQKLVGWSKLKLASHKRASCPSASAEEKRKFAKRSHEESVNNSDDRVDGEQPAQEDSTDDTSTKLANFFFRTGISFRLADSAAFKDLVKSLNPTYASTMPSSRSLAGPLLDQQYTKCLNVLNEAIEASNNLTLISDGWTNIRGDHIVNFCIKAPSQKSYFYSSINTSGISQNSQAVADAICEVIDQIGPEKLDQS